MAEGPPPKYKHNQMQKDSFAAGKAAGMKIRKKKADAAKKKASSRRSYRSYGGGSRSAVIYPNVFHGYGDYHQNPNDSFGTRWGGQLGSFAGEMLGGAAQNLLMSLATGLGDYQVKSNTLLAPEPPTIINDSVKGGITFRHKEYVKDIITSATPGAFNLESFQLNPGNEKLFTWLSQVAPNFEQYSIEGMILHFRSLSADALNSTNTALGAVIMATNYDSLDVNFSNKGEMENYEWGMSCKPSNDMLHPIECAPRQTPVTELYVLNGPVPTGADPRLYNWGNFQIATNGFQGTSVNIGELWVTYQIRLLKPKIFSTKGLEIGTFIQCTNSYTDALPLGNGSVTSLFDSLGVFYDAPNSNIGLPITSIPKVYMVNIIWQGSATTITYPTVTLSNASLVSYGTPVANMNVPSSGIVSARASYTFIIKAGVSSLPVMSFGAAGVLPNAGTQVSVRITEINPFSFS